MQSVGVFVGGYGILPYPRHPLKSSHRIHGSFWQRIFSHGFHGFPQMFRLRYWRRGYGRMPYPPNLCASVPICGRLSLPEGSVCSACSVGTLYLFALLVLQRQLHQRGSILPRISRISRWLGCVIGGVGMAGMPYPPNLCVSVSICGRLSLPEGSVCSACSVGTLSPSAWLVHLRQVHPLRVPPESAPSAIGLRPPPDQIASAVRSDSVRHPIRFRPLHDAISSVCILRRLRCNTQCVYVLHPFMFAKLRNKFDF